MSLKQLMKSKGITQECIVIEFRKKFKHFKYQQQVSAWVRGAYMPDLLSVYYLAKLFDEPLEIVIEACLKSAGLL